MKYKCKGLSTLLVLLSIFGFCFNCYAKPTDPKGSKDPKNPQEEKEEKEEEKEENLDLNNDGIPDADQDYSPFCDNACLSNKHRVNIERNSKTKTFSITAKKGKFNIYVIRKTTDFINGKPKHYYDTQRLTFDFDSNPSLVGTINYFNNGKWADRDVEIIILMSSSVPGKLGGQRKLINQYNGVLGSDIHNDVAVNNIIAEQLNQYEYNNLYNSSYVYATSALIYAPSSSSFSPSQELKNACYDYTNHVPWVQFRNPSSYDIKNKKGFEDLYNAYGNLVTKNDIPYCRDILSGSGSSLDVDMKTLYQMMLAVLADKKAKAINAIPFPTVNPSDFDKVFQLADGEKPDLTGAAGLKCDSSLNCFINNKTKFDQYVKDPKAYPYVNRKRYYASNTHVDHANLTNQKDPNKKKLKCTRKCSETLTVDYGAPIASKAGVCFEYKVKVHSKVECNSHFDGRVPQISDYPLCNPIPACWHREGNWTGTQGGPNEDYDMCIAKCDGGKYTKKCSNACYKKVYGKNNLPDGKFIDVNSKHSGGRCTDKNGKRLPVGKGYYYWSGNSIKWNPGKDANHWDSYARFYFEGGRGSSTVYYDYDCGDRGGSGNPFVSSTEGFKLIFINGWICDASCTYEGCHPGDDLNQNDVLDKYYDDLLTFNTEFEKCTVATTCSEKTAEFTMTINYDTHKKPKDKLTYPFTYSDNKYKADKDQLSTWRVKGNPINTSDKDSSTIRSYDYCYYKDSGSDDEYEIEWSFGGTWLHRKNGNISYKKPAAVGEYYLLKGKYCLPKNVKPVNGKWWAMFDNYKTAINNGTIYNPTASEIAAVNNQLKGNSTKSDGYNINGKMRDFGYFGWNIDVNCFYALPDHNCPEGSVNCDPPAHPDNYIIRPVSNKNLFPNDDREIGYNWKLEDNVVDGYNAVMYGDKYDIEKSRNLIESITTNNQLSDDNLDYQFVLTPSDLRTIKKEKKVFGDWANAGGLFNSYGEADPDGKIREPQVVYYTSDLVTNYSNKRPEHGNKKLGGEK